MKLDIPLCTTEICSHDMAELEKILSKKYKKMVWFYRAIAPYEEEIVSLNYNPETAEEILEVVLDFSDKSDCKELVRKLRERVNEVRESIDIEWDVVHIGDVRTLTIQAMLKE